MEIVTLGKPAPKPPPPSFFVALSLGFEQFDRAALCAVVRRDKDYSGTYEGRHFEVPNVRLFEPGTALVKLGDAVADLLERFQQNVKGGGRLRLMIDFGGAGPLAGNRIFFRICDERKLTWARNMIIPATITSGTNLITTDVGGINVRFIPASYLASAARDALEEQRLSIAAGIPDAEQLPGVLLRTRAPRSASDDLIPLRRESDRENTIFALQLALWGANDPDVSRDNYLHVVSIPYNWEAWAQRHKG
jgi:hypothetical protein